MDLLTPFTFLWLELIYMALPYCKVAGKYEQFGRDILITEQIELNIRAEFQICIYFKGKRKTDSNFELVESRLGLHFLCILFLENLHCEFLRITAVQD